MIKNLVFKEKKHTDICMYQCGEEKCSPGHFFGPAVRDHFLIHYIFEGQGFFQVNNKTYHLKKGQGFLICPDIVTYYQADSINPWHYAWVGFNGLKAKSYLNMASLTPDNPIFTYNKDDHIKKCFEKMLGLKTFKISRETRLLANLYLFLSHLIENAEPNINTEKNRKELYANKVVEFIEMNYSRKITIVDAAKYVGLDRSYLSYIFKETLNMSPQKFLINFRINKACELMKNNLLSIGDIARSVSYDDQFLFSKTFKKIKGLSPSDYRKKIILPLDSTIPLLRE